MTETKPAVIYIPEPEREIARLALGSLLAWPVAFCSAALADGNHSDLINVGSMYLLPTFGFLMALIAIRRWIPERWLRTVAVVFAAAGLLLALAQRPQTEDYSPFVIYFIGNLIAVAPSVLAAAVLGRPALELARRRGLIGLSAFVGLGVVAGIAAGVVTSSLAVMGILWDGLTFAAIFAFWIAGAVTNLGFVWLWRWAGRQGEPLTG
jgi:hypothetical protein